MRLLSSWSAVLGKVPRSLLSSGTAVLGKVPRSCLSLLSSGAAVPAVLTFLVVMVRCNVTLKQWAVRIEAALYFSNVKASEAGFHRHGQRYVCALRSLPGSSLSEVLLAGSRVIGESNCPANYLMQHVKAFQDYLDMWTASKVPPAEAGFLAKTIHVAGLHDKLLQGITSQYELIERMNLLRAVMPDNVFAHLFSEVLSKPDVIRMVLG